MRASASGQRVAGAGRCIGTAPRPAPLAYVVVSWRSMGHQLDMFERGRNPNARVVVRTGDHIAVRLDRTGRCLMLDATVLPRDLAKRLRPGTWLRVDHRRRSDRRIQILDAPPVPPAD